MPPSNSEHVWRYVQPRLGAARVKSGYRLRAGVAVKVTELYRDRMACWVVTDWGASLRMLTQNLDFGYEFKTRRGEWIPESDPRALRWLRRVRAELMEGSPPRHVGDYGLTLELATIDHVLRRNGWSEKWDVKRGPPCN